MRDTVFVEIAEDFGSDEELSAECRLIGTLMLAPDHFWSPIPGLGPLSFCQPFHRAAYYAIMWLLACDQRPTPEAVWAMVKGHPDAQNFGFEHIVDFAVDAASPDTFASDMEVLMDRSFRRGGEALRRAAQ